MNTKNNLDIYPTRVQLLKSVGVAAVIAGVLLVTAVLPAEYGIDPTGIGGRLGLTILSMAGEAKAAPVSPAAAAAAPAPTTASASESAPGAKLLLSSPALATVWRSPSAFRSDEIAVTLQSKKGVEIKADMQADERLVFSWTATGGAVSFDMHGEKMGAASDEFTSYWKGRDATEGHGQFQAPFAGNHGWYWENRSDSPVTILVKTSGFYQKLYKP